MSSLYQLPYNYQEMHFEISSWRLGMLGPAIQIHQHKRLCSLSCMEYEKFRIIGKWHSVMKLE